jgi:hypothetical protein
MDNLHFNEMIDGDVCFLLDQPVQLFLIVLAHWNNIPRVESWLHSNTIQILSQPVFELASLYCVLSGKEANPSFIFFGLTPQSTALKASRPTQCGKWSLVKFII